MTPTGVKSSLNLGECFAPRAKVCQNPGQGFTPWGMACPKSQAYNSCVLLVTNAPRGRVPPSGWLALASLSKAGRNKKISA